MHGNTEVIEQTFNSFLKGAMFARAGDLLPGPRFTKLMVCREPEISIVEIRS